MKFSPESPSDELQKLGEVRLTQGKYKNSTVKEAAEDMAYVKWLKSHTSKEKSGWQQPLHEYIEYKEKRNVKGNVKGGGGGGEGSGSATDENLEQRLSRVEQNVAAIEADRQIARKAAAQCSLS